MLKDAEYRSGNPLDNITLLHLFILWYILGTVFNTVVNYFTLRKVCQKIKNPSRKYLFYCLNQSLTNRYLYLDQQESNAVKSLNKPRPRKTSKYISNIYEKVSDADGNLEPKENNKLPSSNNNEKGYDADGYLNPTEGNKLPTNNKNKNGYDADGYLKPNEGNKLPSNNKNEKGFDVDGYFMLKETSMLPSNNALPKNEVYSYAYMHLNKFKK